MMLWAVAFLLYAYMAYSVPPTAGLAAIMWFMLYTSADDKEQQR